MSLTIKTFLTILAFSGITFGQTSDNDALFGIFNTRNDAARICLATAGPSGAPWCLNSMGFEWHNGPRGEETYLNHTGGFGYNVDFVGNKVVPGIVSYMFSNESKYRNGVAGQPGAFMTEHHFNWASPDNSIAIRPLGFTVQYDTGDVGFALHGSVRLFRQFSNGGAMWGIIHDDGQIDMTAAPNGRIAFKNNTWGLLWQNSRKDNSVAPLMVDDRDRVIVGGGQQETIINSARLIYAHPQCGAISDSDGSAQDNVRVLNSLLTCLRGNGQIAPSPALAKGDLPICVGDEAPQPAKTKLRRARIQR